MNPELPPNPISGDPHEAALAPIRTMLGFALRLANDYVDGFVSAHSKQVGLQRNSILVLRLIYNRPLNQITIANLARINRNQIVTIVDELETQGLAVRDRNPSNRRERLVTITSAGREAYDRASASIIRAAQESIMPRYSVVEWDKMIELIWRMVPDSPAYDDL